MGVSISGACALRRLGYNGSGIANPLRAKCASGKMSANLPSLANYVYLQLRLAEGLSAQSMASTVRETGHLNLGETVAKDTKKEKEKERKKRVRLFAFVLAGTDSVINSKVGSCMGIFGSLYASITTEAGQTWSCLKMAGWLTSVPCQLACPSLLLFSLRSGQDSQ